MFALLDYDTDSDIVLSGLYFTLDLIGDISHRSLPTKSSKFLHLLPMIRLDPKFTSVRFGEMFRMELQFVRSQSTRYDCFAIIADSG